MLGTRLPDCPIGEFPVEYDERPYGSYWRVLVRPDHPDGPRALDVREHAEDRRWWGGDDPRYEQNLTGGVWGIVTPNGLYGMLSIHTVREHDDGTISVRPGDGSSNSILVQGGPDGASWHGYMEHGVWSEC